MAVAARRITRREASIFGYILQTASTNAKNADLIVSTGRTTSNGCPMSPFGQGKGRTEVRLRWKRGALAPRKRSDKNGLYRHGPFRLPNLTTTNNHLGTPKRNTPQRRTPPSTASRRRLSWSNLGKWAKPGHTGVPFIRKERHPCVTIDCLRFNSAFLLQGDGAR
jgi:hypothetical protein